MNFIKLNCSDEFDMNPTKNRVDQIFLAGSTNTGKLLVLLTRMHND